MESWDRVLIYGTYDGFVRSTVDPLKIAVRLDDGERVEVPSECVISADQIVKKDEIKLKEVIERIKGFEFGTQVVWISQILDELGSDYGLVKYKAGYEQGKFDGAIEHEKVAVPQFVADWYEKNKDSFDYNLWEYLTEWERQEPSDFKNWINDKDIAFQTLVNMHQFGYEVEKEKRYLVKVVGMSGLHEYLNFDTTENRWIFFDSGNTKTYRTHHTRKEIEESGFGWVFECPGIEIEEVEE